MTALHVQIDTLEAALQRLRTGDLQVFNQLPFMLDELRKGADALERHQQELVSLYEVGQEIVSILKLDQLLESIMDRTIVLVGSVEFRFSDTGPGIPDEIRDTLFEPFVSHGKATGTGLGPAIAKKTVQDHGGTIRVESKAGQGATFIIRLPRVEDASPGNTTDR